jgi:hypothetical protein
VELLPPPSPWVEALPDPLEFDVDPLPEWLEEFPLEPPSPPWSAYVCVLGSRQAVVDAAAPKRMQAKRDERSKRRVDWCIGGRKVAR